MMRIIMLLALVLSAQAFADGHGNDPWLRVALPPWAAQLVGAIQINGLPAEDQITAPNCEYPVKNYRVGESSRSLPEFSGKLSDPSYYVKDLLAILGLNPMSKPIAQKFLPLLESQTIEVRLVTQDALASRSIAGAAAFCESQNGTKRIYMDKSAEIGILVPVFLHELVHCLDEEADRYAKLSLEKMQKGVDHLTGILNVVAKEKVKDAETLRLSDLSPDQLLSLRKMKRSVQQFDQFRSYRTERRAYNAEHEIGKWMLSYADAYYRAKGRVPASFLVPVNDEFILQHYGIHRPWFEQFKSGSCTAAL